MSNKGSKKFIMGFYPYCPTEIPLQDYKEQIESLYQQCGIYAFLGENDEILYIGKSIDLSSRIPSSLNERRKLALISAILYFPVETEADTHILEKMLIAENKPILNGEGNSKDYPVLYHSNIDVIRDFKKLDFDFDKYEKRWQEKQRLKQIEERKLKKLVANYTINNP